ncbi:hypothetical protein SASPL_146809 [Salvia splendens]|uniref:Uncharacterized protein n=1 Tax=Salvia splendens TaxID=180675 RepID=A0A8X8WDF2_SALSN|nr:hypothetical protein SASPL_146809 [Salvia splendens]
MATATTFLPANPKLPQKRISTVRNGVVLKRFAIKAQQGGGEGNSVDENMIVLRMRIKKMKVIESVGGGEGEGEEGVVAAPEWKEWEKRVFTHYHEGVLDTVGLLQSYLMNTRPSVALGMLALIAMTVPFSTSVVVSNALKVAKGLLAGSHVCIDIDF